MNIKTILSLLIIISSPLTGTNPPEDPKTTLLKKLKTQLTEYNNKTFLGVVANTGSMKPTFDTDSILLIQEVNITDIKPNDIIAYRADKKNIIHRVIETNPRIITKGDNSHTQDPWVITQENLIGRVVSIHFIQDKIYKES